MAIAATVGILVILDLCKAALTAHIPDTTSPVNSKAETISAVARHDEMRREATMTTFEAPGVDGVCGYVDGSSACVWNPEVSFAGCCDYINCTNTWELYTTCIQSDTAPSDSVEWIWSTPGVSASPLPIEITCYSNGGGYCQEYTFPDLNAKSFNCDSTPRAQPITVMTTYPGQPTVSVSAGAAATRTKSGATQTYTICIGNACPAVNAGNALSGTARGNGLLLSTGAIVGIVFGGIIALVTVGVCIWRWRKQKKVKRGAQTAGHPSVVPPVQQSFAPVAQTPAPRTMDARAQQEARLIRALRVDHFK